MIHPLIQFGHGLVVPESSRVIDSDQLVAGFLGAALALLGQWLVARARRAATARSLSLAFWEELSAAQFASDGVTDSGEPQYLRIGGFSSQTFDSLFREMAVSLPDSIARDLMRYHWRVKFMLLEQKTFTYLDRLATFYHEAKALRENLLQRLQSYSDRAIVRLMLRAGE